MAILKRINGRLHTRQEVFEISRGVKENDLLFEGVYDYSRDLVKSPDVIRFVHNLSTQDLAELTSVVSSETSLGKPVNPPTEFISAVKRFASKREWVRLYRLLVKWNDESESEKLSPDGLEYLMMGLLWETLLITECERRFN